MVIRIIHNCPLQPFSQDYDLASHTTHVVYVNFIGNCGGIYNLTSTPCGRFFEKLFHGRFIYSQSSSQKSTYIHNWPLQPFSQNY